MKNTSTIILLLNLVSCFLTAQVPDSTFGVPNSFEGYAGGPDRYGVTASNFENRHDRAYSALHLNNGGIVLAGHTRGQGGIDFALVRLLSNGQYDTEAGPQGQIRIDLGYANDSCLIAALTPEEMIMMGGCVTLPGQSGYVALVAKVNLSGQLDAAFGNGGHVVLDLPSDYEMVTKMIPLPDGKTLIAGNAYFGGSSIAFPDSTALFIGRLLSDGQIDSTFGDSGFVFRRYNQACNSTILRDIVVDSEERIIATGGLYSPYPDVFNGTILCFNPNIHVCRYLPNGQPDPVFGSGGIIELPYTQGWANSLYVDEGDKIIVAGMISEVASLPTHVFISRILHNGQPDSTFAANGRFKMPIFGSTDFSAPWNILKIGDAYYLSLGDTPFEGYPSFSLIRIGENGVFDSTFGAGQGFGFSMGFNSIYWLPTVPFYIEQISTIDSVSIFLTGTYRALGQDNMMIGKIRFGTVVSTETEVVQEMMKVFPNPVQNGKLYFDCSHTTQTGPANIQLYDLYGRVVHSRAVMLLNGVNELEVAGIPNGLYVLEVVGQGFRRVAKVVVQE